MALLHLLRALHVDVQDHSAAVSFQHVPHRPEAGPVNVTVHVRVLDELAILYRLLNVPFTLEVVVNPVHLAGPRRASGVAHAKSKSVLRRLRHQPFNERALARATGPHKNEHAGLRRRRRRGRRR